jgi:hypothetical protein
MQMLGFMKKNGFQLVALLAAASCSSSSNNNNDARGTDARTTYDANTDGTNDSHFNVPDGGIDAPSDGPIADASTAPDSRDTSVSFDSGNVPFDGGRTDGPADAPRDSAPGDVRTTIDGASVDGASSDAGGLAVDGGVTTTFTATLTGAQETPPTITTAVGSALFTLSADRTQLSYHVIHNVVGGTASHIHLGGGGEPGAVIYPLTPFSTDMSGVINIAPADAVNLAQGMLYVNVHSTQYPNGEIRGQILRPGETLWVASLTGSQETPSLTTTATGHASIIVDSTQTTIHYHVSTTGLTPTGAQIQDAIATLSGNVIYQLSPLAAVIDGTQAITATDNGAIADRHWYVNILTASNTNGEIRGQVLQPGEMLYTAMLSGADETPPITTSATGNAQFVLDAERTSLRYEAMFSGLSATASHIHLGAMGMAGPVLYPLTLVSPTLAKGSQTVTPDDLLNLDAGLLYINAHTAANPNGEIRGQIGKL